jgi:hypothetical protein
MPLSSNTFSIIRFRDSLGLLRVEPVFTSGSSTLFSSRSGMLTARRLPSYGRVWSALLQGSEASLPAYDFLLHFSAKWRATVICCFAYLRLRLCSAAPLSRHSGCSLWNGIQLTRRSRLAWGRSPALCAGTACFASAILLWDQIDALQRRPWRIPVLSILLVLAISLHLYAVLFVPCFGAMELLWSVQHRCLRLSVWLGLFLAGASCFVW